MRWQITKKEISLTKLKQQLSRLKKTYNEVTSDASKGKIICQIMLVQKQIDIKKMNARSGLNKKNISIVSVGNVGLSKR